MIEKGEKILKKTKLGKKRFLIGKKKENKENISQEILIVGNNINKKEEETKTSFLIKLIMKAYYLSIWKNKIKSLKYFSRKVNKQRINFKKFIKEISMAIEQHKFNYFNDMIEKIDKLELPKNIKHNKFYGTIKIVDKNKLKEVSNEKLELKNIKNNYYDELIDINKGFKNDDIINNDYEYYKNEENNYLKEILYEDGNKEMDYNNNDFVETEYNYDEDINNQENYEQTYYQENEYYNNYENENIYNEREYLNQDNDYDNNIYEEDPYFQNDSYNEGYYNYNLAEEPYAQNSKEIYEHYNKIDFYNKNKAQNTAVINDIYIKPKIGNNIYYNNNNRNYSNNINNEYGYGSHYNIESNISNKRAFPSSSHNHVFYISK